MDHPAVAQAIAFAVPHARLGEDVAAAVVLRPHDRHGRRDSPVRGRAPGLLQGCPSRSSWSLVASRSDRQAPEARPGENARIGGPRSRRAPRAGEPSDRVHASRGRADGALGPRAGPPRGGPRRELLRAGRRFTAGHPAPDPRARRPARRDPLHAFFDAPPWPAWPGPWSPRARAGPGRRCALCPGAEPAPSRTPSTALAPRAGSVAAPTLTISSRYFASAAISGGTPWWRV